MLFMLNLYKVKFNLGIIFLEGLVFQSDNYNVILIKPGKITSIYKYKKKKVCMCRFMYYYYFFGWLILM